MVRYIVDPSVVAVLLFAALRLQPIHRVNLLISLVSVTASVYGSELFVQWRNSSLYAQSKPVMNLLEDSTSKKKDAAILTKEWGVDVDTRTADEVLAALRAHAVDAVPIITASNHLFVTQTDGSIKSRINLEGREVMPLAGVSNRVTLLCNESGQWIRYQSDGRGFNNSNGIWQSDRLEIAALGDSFTQGYCVPRERNFVALIRQRHPATLNLGVAGDGPC